MNSQILSRESSWVIIRKSDNYPVLETFSKSVAEKVNSKKYAVIPILEYLQSLNK